MRVLILSQYYKPEPVPKPEELAQALTEFGHEVSVITGFPNYPSGDLYVTGPTTSSFDCVYKVTPQGNVSTFYRGLGRPQGMAFDMEGHLYVAASLSGKRGIVRIDPSGQASLAVAGAGLVGLAFAPGRSAVLATTSAVHHLAWNIQGLPLPDFQA